MYILYNSKMIFELIKILYAKIINSVLRFYSLKQHYNLITFIFTKFIELIINGLKNKELIKFKKIQVSST